MSFAAHAESPLAVACIQMEPQVGAKQGVSGTLTNSGTLFASGAHSLIDIVGGATITGGGVAEIANGTLDIESAGDNQNVDFLAGGSGVLDLGVLGSAYSGVVSGFGQNVHQFIDFTAIGSAGATLSYTSTSSSSGVLTVFSGGTSASIDLSGHYTSASFHIVAGVGGTVEIFDPPIKEAKPFGPSNLTLFTNYLAAAFPGDGHYNSGLITEMSQAGSEPILTHPRG